MAHGCGCQSCGDGSVILCPTHDPHAPGLALCNACGEEWDAVVDGPECPACERQREADEARRDEAREA
jgi:hypothetical protein